MGNTSTDIKKKILNEGRKIAHPTTWDWDKIYRYTKNVFLFVLVFFIATYKNGIKHGMMLSSIPTLEDLSNPNILIRAIFSSFFIACGIALTLGGINRLYRDNKRAQTPEEKKQSEERIVELGKQLDTVRVEELNRLENAIGGLLNFLKSL